MMFFYHLMKCYIFVSHTSLKEVVEGDDEPTKCRTVTLETAVLYPEYLCG